MNNEILARVGVIGLGDHSHRSHLSYLAAMPDLCEITALADIDEARIAATNTKYNLSAAGYTNWRELVANPNVDAVLIMTPDRFHTQQLAGSVAVGKHVFCEKPLASTAEEYEVLQGALQEADKAGLVVSTCHPRRFDPPFITAKNYIQDRQLLQHDFGTKQELGDVTGFMFNFNYHEPSKRGLHQSLMFDHLNHEVDLMHFMFGTSDIAQAIKHHDSEVAFRVYGEREDGIAFDFTGARLRHESIYPEDMRISFENGNLAMNMHNGSAVLRANGDTIKRKNEVYKTDYITRFAAINQQFLRSVAGLELPYISAREMLINTKTAIDLHA